MKQANEIYLGFLLGAIKEDEIILWAQKILLSSDPISNDARVIELASLIEGSYADPATILKEIVAEYFADFKVPSFETETYAMQILRELCVGHLLGKLKKKDFYVAVFKIHYIFQGPHWLGELYYIMQKMMHYLDENQYTKSVNSEIKYLLTQL